MMKDKLYICGSLCRMYDSDYYNRKCIHFFKDYKVTLVYDDTVFHDQTEYKYLPKHLSRDNVYAYEKFLRGKLRKTVPNSIKIKSWHSYVRDKRELLRTISKLDNKMLQIDIIKCTKCGKEHVGPFQINGRELKTPCGVLDINSIDTRYIRIKKGFLQFIILKYVNGKVLLNEKFFLQNKNLIDELKIADKIVVFHEKQSAKFEEKEDNHIISKYVIGEKYKDFLSKIIFFRHFLKQAKRYKFADLIRRLLEKKGIVVRDNYNYYIVERKKK